MSKSKALFERAQQFIPGGVNSPVRAFKGVGGSPLFFAKAKGPYLYDEDGNTYIDYIGSWGPMILGHQDEDVLHAIQKAIEKAISFGAPCAYEVDLAELICQLIPSVEQVRMVNSGTEATMTALRLARGYTGRDLIVKFEGCYHGHSDSLLIKAGSGALTLGVPSSPGVPASLSKHTLNLAFNDIPGLQEAFGQYGEKIAAVIVEPIPGNMGCVLPDRNFLLALRQACTDSGAVLIFDEVISGFRVGLEGAEGLYQIRPDLSTFGKIIGGGMPVGAIGGKKSIMSHLSPVGPVYQAGTLSGNPVAMAAGFATLSKLKSDLTFYQRLGKTTQTLVLGLQQIAKEKGIPVQINSLPGLFTLFFTENPVTSFKEVMTADVNRFKQYYHGMLNEGIYFGPSAYESALISITHDETCIDKTLTAAQKVFAHL